MELDLAVGFFSFAASHTAVSVFTGKLVQRLKVCSLSSEHLSIFWTWWEEMQLLHSTALHPPQAVLSLPNRPGRTCFTPPNQASF